jgi:multidrug resistance efflux pump
VLVLVAACNAWAMPAADERLVLTGVVRATQASAITAPLADDANLVIQWIAEDGTVVAAGERIAELDPTPFLERLREARTELATVETRTNLADRADELALAAKRLGVSQAEIAREKAALRAEVTASLVPARVARDSARALVAAETALGAAKRALTGAQETLALEGKIRTSELERQRANLVRLEKITASLVLVAPRAGVVRRGPNLSENRLLRAGDTVEQGQVLATQPDLAQPMEVVADLSDVDDGRVAVGATATCVLDAFPEAQHPCKVLAIAAIARAPTQESLRRSFAVQLSLAAHVRPGLSVKVTFGRADTGVVARVDAPIDVTGELASASALDVDAPAFRDRSYLTIAWLAPTGKTVAAGEPVMKLDESEIARQLDETEIEIRETEQRLARKRSEVALSARDSDLRIREAESASKRAALKADVPPALVASLEVKAQKLDAELARITLEHARATAEFAKRSDAADLEDLVEQLARSKRRLVELREMRTRFVVNAPHAGTWVTTREVGGSIYQSDHAGQIVALDRIVGIGIVDEVDLGRVKVGAPVTLRLAALPDGELRGKVAEVTSDVLEREHDPGKVVRVKLSLDASGGLARPAMKFRGAIGGAR